ncbi:MAG: PBSX family phage terminase large subunit [Deltaproteobacteria bacterium]|nr:PBSX family phage terminase large subunit [Deltaproteobacteria bacterium]
MFQWGEFSQKGRDSIEESNARINIWDGAVRSGKTICSIVRWIDFVWKCPGDVALVMTGKTERTLRRNILNPICSMLGPEMSRPNLGSGYFYMYGRPIEIVGANDERAQEKIRGATLGGAYGDELTLWPESYFKMLMSRLSVPGARLFGTTNPDSPFHWLKTDYLDREDELNLKRFQFELKDNPNLDPAYVREIEKEYTGLWYKRFILGLWVQAEGAIYDMWDDAVHTVSVKKVLSGLKIKQFRNNFAACDYGTGNPTVFGLFGYNWKLPAYLTREYYYDSRKAGRQKTDSEYANDFERFVKGTRIQTVYVDPSAASFIAELRKRRINVTPAKNSVLDGIRFVGTLLRNHEFFVDKGCDNSCREFAAYVWDPGAQKKGEDIPIKERDHCMDMIRYGLFTHFFREFAVRILGTNLP